MAVPEATLYFVGALAGVVTAGMFVDFGDDATHVVLGFAGAILWFAMGLMSFDVITSQSLCCQQTQAIMPAVYLGMGLGGVVTLFSVGQLVALLGGITGSNSDIIES